MFFDSVENVHAVFAVNHIDCKPPLAKTSCATNPVKVCLIVRVPVFVHRKVKVDHHGHLLHINACIINKTNAKMKQKIKTLQSLSKYKTVG